jgi:hypothetical protein
MDWATFWANFSQTYLVTLHSGGVVSLGAWRSDEGSLLTVYCFEDKSFKKCKLATYYFL